VAVTVLGASFPNLPALLDNTVATWTLNKSLVDPALTLQPGKGLRLGAYRDLSASQYARTLYPDSGGRVAIAARVGEGGPIAAIAAFNSISFSDALQNELSTTAGLQDFPNHYLVSTPTVFSNLPPGATIVITIFRSGVMFRDGGTVKTFTAADLANGILNLEFLFPKGTPGGYCHYVKIYDSAGNIIATR